MGRAVLPADSALTHTLNSSAVLLEFRKHSFEATRVRVWFGLCAVVPVAVGCQVIVIVVVLVAMSVSSSVWSTLWLLDNLNWFTFVFNNRRAILLWLNNNGLVRSIWSWCWFLIDWLLPGSLVSRIVGSTSFSCFDWFNRCECRCWDCISQGSSPATQPVWLFLVNWCWLDNYNWFRCNIGWSLNHWFNMDDRCAISDHWCRLNIGWFDYLMVDYNWFVNCRDIMVAIVVVDHFVMDYWFVMNHFHWFNVHWLVNDHWLNICNWRRWKWFDELMMHGWFSVICHNWIGCKVFMVLITTFMSMHSIAMVMDNNLVVMIIVVVIVYNRLHMPMSVIFMNGFNIWFRNVMNHWGNMHWFDISWFNMMDHWLNICNWRRWKWLDELMVHGWFSVISYNWVSCKVLVVFITTFVSMYRVAVIVYNRLLIMIMVDNWCNICRLNMMHYWLMIRLSMMYNWLMVWLSMMNSCCNRSMTLNYVRVLTFVEYFSRVYRREFSWASVSSGYRD